MEQKDGEDDMIKGHNQQEKEQDKEKEGKREN